MKSFLIVFAYLTFSFSEFVFAQEKIKTEISSVEQKEQTVEFTITSSRPFYSGNNIHILHIGKKDFSLSKQYKKDKTGVITFFIPLDDFNGLTEGDDVWMSYGNKLRSDADERKDIKRFCKKNEKTCWSLGKFSKQVQTHDK